MTTNAPADGVPEPLKLRFLGSLVEQLGAQLYPSVTSTVAELVSNAWDSDAKNVWVSVPLDRPWEQGSEITVLDDGHGMAYEDARTKYLIVGRKRRMAQGELTESGLRRAQGRKGIGKLAAFGTAGWLELTTLRDGRLTAFAMDYDTIREQEAGSDYEVLVMEQPEPPMNPDTGAPLTSGTLVRLKNLKAERIVAESQFRSSMARRFAVDQTEMQVVINGIPLPRFAVDTEFRFPGDDIPDGVQVDASGWAMETLPGDRPVRWWIGFTPHPLDDQALKGISILANRKMVQRPFVFQQAGGVSGQLGLESLVGEVEANWLDDGRDIDSDMQQANKDSLQLEDARLVPLIEWGQMRLRWALRRRERLLIDKREGEVDQGADLTELLEPFTRSEQLMFRNMAKEYARKAKNLTRDQVADFVGQIVTNYNDKAVRGLIEEIQLEEPEARGRIWQLIDEFGLIDARRKLSLIQGHLQIIEKLEGAVHGGAVEVPDLHEIIKKSPWLLDPRWDLLDDEVRNSDLEGVYTPEEEGGVRMDFIFILGPRPPASQDQIIVVEIKRGTYPNGREKHADQQEVAKFAEYLSVVEESFNASTERPNVIRGLMIAEGYTTRGERVKRQLEEPGRLEFKTWSQVIDYSKRFHLGWLEVTKMRALSGRR